jgi:maleate cis-trans isomerase
MNIIFPWYRLGMIQAHQANLSAYQGSQVAPEGVVTYFRHQNLDEYTLAAVEANLPSLKESVDSLAEAGVQRIVMGGVPIGAALGRERALDIIGEIASWSGVQASSSFEDHLRAYAHLGAKKVAVASRWPEELSKAVKKYLEDAGFQVPAHRFGGGTLQGNKKKSPETDHEMALALGRGVLADAQDADVLMLPGGNGYFLYAAPILEQELGIPVVTNHTASLFSALTAFDGPLPVKPDPRWGRLLQSL